MMEFKYANDPKSVIKRFFTWKSPNKGNARYVDKGPMQIM